MKITKSKLQARLQKKLDKLVAEKVDYIKSFIPYRDAAVTWEDKYRAALKASTSDTDWDQRYKALGARPNRYDFGSNPAHHDNDRKTKVALRNMAD